MSDILGETHGMPFVDNHAINQVLEIVREITVILRARKCFRSLRAIKALSGGDRRSVVIDKGVFERVQTITLSQQNATEVSVNAYRLCNS